MKTDSATQGGLAYAVLGQLLDYPEQPLLDALPEAMGLLQGERALSREARAGLDQFFTYLRTRDLITLQENYVARFDRGRATSLHLFEHVHGESRDRGQAMVDLLQMYEQHRLYLAPGQLPDYLPVFLEYLSRLPSQEARGLLGETAEILQSIGAGLAKRGSAYGFVIGAVLSLGGLARGDVPSELSADDAASPPGQADYRALDAAWADEPVRFVGATPPAQAPVHFHERRPGAALRSRTEESRHE
jgi:nitrate reductase delta subunit